MIARATELGYTVRADADSALAGRKGNVEICLLLEYGSFFKSADFFDVL